MQSAMLVGAAKPTGCIPAGQRANVLLHWEAAVAPVELVYVPLGQGEHEGEPAVAAKKPKSHGVHAVNGAAEKEPALQAEQVANPEAEAM